jgi:hypothetical protein
MIPITGAACHIEIGITNWDIPNTPFLVDRRALALRRRGIRGEAIETLIRDPRNRPPLGVRRGTTRLLLDSRKASILHGRRLPVSSEGVGQNFRGIDPDYQTPTHVEMIELVSDLPPIIHAPQPVRPRKAPRGRDMRIVPRVGPRLPERQGQEHNHRRLVRRAVDTRTALHAVQRPRIAPPRRVDASHLQSRNECRTISISAIPRRRSRSPPL